MRELTIHEVEDVSGAGIIQDVLTWGGEANGTAEPICLAGASSTPLIRSVTSPAPLTC